MRAFAELLDRLAYTHGRNAKLRLLRDYFGHTPDPDRGWALAALTLILTGMGQDGMKGGKEIINAGGVVVAQDEGTSVVWGMPGAVTGAGLCSAVLPLSDIAPFLRKTLSRMAA